MNNKYTLLSLCHEYNKIEIPIIQRDYAQGRESETSVRGKFVDYLVDHLSAQKPIELDFVYGNKEITQGKNNEKILTFVPVDGQQRLTTLWLLHWFLCVKDNCLLNYKEYLRKFTYETRPSAHDFCQRLMDEDFSTCSLTNIDKDIIKQEWFDNEWLKDGTVNGMLTMLKTFSVHKKLFDKRVSIALLGSPHNLVSFYFVHLENFGLSEDIYIRMNARGKILTKFENFKSEFYKIIKDDPNAEAFKDKIEYQWVSNLWEYRSKDSYVIDSCFMNYLQFITRMLYFRKEKARKKDGYETDFTSNKTLAQIYSISENLEDLIFALDELPSIRSITTDNLLWEKEPTTLAGIFNRIIKNAVNEVPEMVIAYSALSYWKKHKGDSNGIRELVRVVRNLIYNTNDRSERDQPTILRSVDKLCREVDTLNYLRKKGFNLEGFKNEQCEEEHFKALLIDNDKSIESLLRKIENDNYFGGNISSILAATYTSTSNKIDDFKFDDSLVDSFNKKRLGKIYNAYSEMKADGFNKLWGELITTSVYIWQKNYGRLVYDSNYNKKGSLLSLLWKYAQSGKNIDDFLINWEKEKVSSILEKDPVPENIRNVKWQIYLLYVISRRIMGKSVKEFFSNGYQFGWLSKENGYTSLYKAGIEGDPWFSEINPIFQTYSSQFRYNMGLYENHALPPEIVKGRPLKIWKRLEEWVKSD